jgi:hypothetical protein
MQTKRTTAISAVARTVIETVEAHAVDPRIVDLALIAATAVVAADLSGSESELESRLHNLHSMLTMFAEERFRTQPPSVIPVMM